MPLLHLPALRRPVSLLRAREGARAPRRPAHRRLRVGRQDPHDPPLPENCGCVSHWVAMDPEVDVMGVNARLMDPEVLAAARVRYSPGP